MASIWGRQDYINSDRNISNIEAMARIPCPPLSPWVFPPEQPENALQYQNCQCLWRVSIPSKQVHGRSAYLDHLRWVRKIPMSSGPRLRCSCRSPLDEGAEPTASGAGWWGMFRGCGYEGFGNKSFCLAVANGCADLRGAIYQLGPSILDRQVLFEHP